VRGGDGKIAHFRSGHSDPVFISLQTLKKLMIGYMGAGYVHGTAYAFCGAYRETGQHLW
jgi:hypothetical protein